MGTARTEPGANGRFATFKRRFVPDAQALKRAWRMAAHAVRMGLGYNRNTGLRANG